MIWIPTLIFLGDTGPFSWARPALTCVHLCLGFLFLGMPLPAWWIPTYPLKLNSKDTGVGRILNPWKRLFMPCFPAQFNLKLSDSRSTYMTVSSLRLWATCVCSPVLGIWPLNSLSIDAYIGKQVPNNNRQLLLPPPLNFESKCQLL
jgi:hypothetical protein